MNTLTAELGLTSNGEALAAVDDHLIALTAPDSPEFEQYLVLRRAIERARAATGLAVIGVTSATMADGKTTTAINMAAALARNRQTRVLLVDADLRAPSVATQLGLSEGTEPGLSELLAEPAFALADGVRRRSAFNLSVLTAGRLGTANPYELFESARFAAIVAEARAAYDYVVIDAPPVIPVADCRVLEAHVDGFLIVVAAHRTPRRLVAETLTALGPGKSLGLVFNRVDRPFPGSYNGYYGYLPKRRNQATPQA